jgi:hypothetical protein
MAEAFVAAQRVDDRGAEPIANAVPSGGHERLLLTVVLPSSVLAAGTRLPCPSTSPTGQR